MDEDTVIGTVLGLGLGLFIGALSFSSCGSATENLDGAIEDVQDAQIYTDTRHSSYLLLSEKQELIDINKSLIRIKRAIEDRVRAGR